MNNTPLAITATGKKRILVVDDDADLCEIIDLHLRQFGYELVATAASGEQAILMARYHQPDLVIMDIELEGEMDGIAAATAIHRDADIPMLFLTSFCSDELLLRVKTVDAMAYILKPLNERELRVAIEMAMYKHETEARLKRSESLSRSILNSVSAEIAVIDANGVIVAVNRAWRDFACSESFPDSVGEFLTPQHGVGMNYLSVCSPVNQLDGGDDNPAQHGILSVLNRSAASFNMEYPCHSVEKQRWFHMSVTPLDNGEGGAVVSHMDISARKLVEADLRIALHEKNVLIKEVHHRVKNNLQVVSSLLRLEAARDLPTEAKAVLANMQSRIQTLAFLHEFLYRHSQFSSVELSAYLRELSILSFRSMYQDPGAVNLVFDLAGLQVNIDQATCCGLLVNELISNSLKHAFFDRQQGQICVALQATESVGWMRLSVSDDGIGIPTDFEEKRERSLGLKLVADLARQIGGDLIIGREAGASFAVRFKGAEDTQNTAL